MLGHVVEATNSPRVMVALEKGFDGASSWASRYNVLEALVECKVVLSLIDTLLLRVRGVFTNKKERDAPPSWEKFEVYKRVFLRPGGVEEKGLLLCMMAGNLLHVKSAEKVMSKAASTLRQAHHLIKSKAKKCPVMDKILIEIEWQVRSIAPGGPSTRSSFSAL
jgi:hypothetical protein